MNKFSIVTKVRNILSSIKYEPNSYWNKRGKNLDKENLYDREQYRIQEKILLEYLKSIKFSSVLELGCGFGRITKVITENFTVSRYSAVDISPFLIEKAKKNIANKNVTFKVNDINNISKNEKFDMVIASEVLMHIKPCDIEKVINDIVSVANIHIVNIDWYSEQKPKIRMGHNFIHNYEEIYGANRDIGKVMKTKIPIEPPSILFHAVKRTREKQL